jgi:hypothetical protein
MFEEIFYYILEALINNKNLTHLDLSGKILFFNIKENYFSDKVCLSLNEILKKDILKELNLSCKFLNI